MKKIFSAAAVILLLSGCKAGPAVTVPAQTSAAKTTIAETRAVMAETAAKAVTTKAAAATAASETAADTAGDPACASEMSGKCKELYSAFLTDIIENGKSYSEKTMFDFYDIDRDGIPELFISYDDYHVAGTFPYTVSGGEVVRLGDAVGSWGMAYISGKYIVSGFTGVGGGSEIFYEKKGDKLIYSDSFVYYAYSEEDRRETGRYRVNDEAVTEEEYKAAYEKYSGGRVNVGRRYKLDRETLDEVFSAAPVPEDENDYKDVYRAFLTDVIENYENYSVESMFDLYDLDGDGIPELFVSHSGIHAYGADIYTVSGGNVVQLAEGYGSYGQVQVSGHYLSESFSNMGSGVEIIYEKRGDELAELTNLRFVIWPGRNDGVTEEYWVNGKPVSEEEYIAEQSKYPGEWEDAGRRYFLNKENAERILS